MNFLYPEIEPFKEQFIKVSELHTIHFEQCGNPNGKPVLFIHGGPGGGIEPVYRRFFNPEKYYIVLVDQRGSGKSVPHAEIKENNTKNLISDFEKIRLQLKIDRWMVFGGSWGSTLGLAYAQAHPEQVTELILRGIYLATEEDNQWLFGGGGANRIFPDFWGKFIAVIPEEERNDLLTAYYRRLTSGNAEIREKAAKAWSGWEASIVKLLHDPDMLKEVLESPAALSLAILECHYMHQHCFLAPNQLLNNIHKIKHIPGVLVHGRYDMVCTAQNAWRLHQAWPESELHYVPDAGHSITDTSLAKKLVEITDRFIS